MTHGRERANRTYGNAFPCIGRHCNSALRLHRQHIGMSSAFHTEAVFQITVYRRPRPNTKLNQDTIL